MLKHLIFSTRREEKQQCFEKKLLFREKYFGYQYLLSLRLDSLLRAKPCAASCGTLAGGSARCPPEGSEEDEEKTKRKNEKDSDEATQIEAVQKE